MLSGMQGVMEQTEKMFRLQGIKKEDPGKSMAKSLSEELNSIKMTASGMTKDGKSAEGMFEQEQDIGKTGTETKKEKMRSDKLGQEITFDKERFEARDMLEQEYLKTQQEVKPQDRSIEKELVSSKRMDFPVIAAPAQDQIVTTGERAVVFQPVSRARTWSPDDMSAYSSVSTEMSALGGKPRLGEYEDIGQFLNVRLYTYKTGVPGENYFKIMISTNDINDLEVLPKEVTFLLDSSKSITEEKLGYIKQGMISSLNEMNPGDRFNVVAFRGDLIKYRDEPVRATVKTVNDARSFINELQAVGQTDVENALYGIIGEPIHRRPSYIVLVTDGRPTTGMLDSREIIRQITRDNNMERPIFCFGGGLRVNKYLLDFISYQNRGWRYFSGRARDMDGDFERFFLEINDPVLLDVRYRVSGLEVEKMYPKFLSDFYKGRPFVLYGRFGNEEDFSVQLLGSVNGTTKEFIFNAAMSNAIPAGPEIAREWAFRKIYHLISEQTMGIGDPETLEEEISRLSRKYNITTPYDVEIEAN